MQTIQRIVYKFRESKTNLGTAIIQVMNLTELNETPFLPPDCSACKQKTLCLPEGLSNEEFVNCSNIITFNKKISKGSRLFHAGDPLRFLYIVKLGSVKSSIVTDEGREQVIGFNMSGEMLGIDGIYHGFHTCTATALEDSEVCVMPYEDLEALCGQSPAIDSHVRRLFSREIVLQHHNLLMLGSMSSTERLAAFLLSLSKRFETRGFSRTEFVLRMTRADIDSFLGLKLETISRALSKFTELGLIEIHQKHVHIVNPKGLRSILQEHKRI